MLMTLSPTLLNWQFQHLVAALRDPSVAAWRQAAPPFTAPDASSTPASLFGANKECKQGGKAVCVSSWCAAPAAADVACQHKPLPKPTHTGLSARQFDMTLNMGLRGLHDRASARLCSIKKRIVRTACCWYVVPPQPNQHTAPPQPGGGGRGSVSASSVECREQCILLALASQIPQSSFINPSVLEQVCAPLHSKLLP